MFAYAKTVVAAKKKMNERWTGKRKKNLLKLFRNICNLLKTWPGKLNCFAVVYVVAVVVVTFIYLFAPFVADML